ncbi:MAG: hypothetical protein AUI57_06290 [Candidatus Rokubacteria bacterium 13_1_40CM_2_68_8]|nr:MAG: hypothetical protein AUI57_06290 [Candidatus Rokubacteria bacterium 13_1_40CM_2_68_8]
MNAGAEVETVAHLDEQTHIVPDALLIAAKPRVEFVVGKADATRIAARWPGAVTVQFWGDCDRAALAEAGVPFWPIKPPALGHMGIIPSGVGPESVVRLQSGGLKVVEVLLRESRAGVGSDWEYVDSL